MNNRHLIASEDMILTNGEVYAKEVWLGDWDNPDNWKEITIEQKILLEEARLKEAND